MKTGMRYFDGSAPKFGEGEGGENFGTIDDESVLPEQEYGMSAAATAVGLGVTTPLSRKKEGEGMATGLGSGVNESCRRKQKHEGDCKDDGNDSKLGGLLLESNEGHKMFQNSTGAFQMSTPQPVNTRSDGTLCRNPLDQQEMGGAHR